MNRRILFAAVLIVQSARVFAAQDATFVLKSGERVSGSLSYDGGYNVMLNVGGQERKFPWGDIAVIAMVAGDPAAAELRQVPANDNAPELERHLVVMRDGSVVKGKLYDISRDGGTITIDTMTRERRAIPSSSIARIYMEGGTARGIYSAILNAPATTPAAPVAAAPATPLPAAPPTPVAAPPPTPVPATPATPATPDRPRQRPR